MLAAKSFPPSLPPELEDASDEWPRVLRNLIADRMKYQREDFRTVDRKVVLAVFDICLPTRDFGLSCCKFSLAAFEVYLLRCGLCGAVVGRIVEWVSIQRMVRRKWIFVIICGELSVIDPTAAQ
ncbi:hypothetical protein AG1IA_01149 [Rhizoctonia solani AG-1 IA]|uniref:Uncharacterized protein n=1 Tax=Thanatephorus cucumeris (strain AG1-IA) TaxID=983506 RepID=L8X6W0_THACA|nr:hypothetical protein AG1IA_01149 [Rhizoctonia solani AG-1 IA]